MNLSLLTKYEIERFCHPILKTNDFYKIAVRFCIKLVSPCPLKVTDRLFFCERWWSKTDQPRPRHFLCGYDVRRNMTIITNLVISNGHFIVKSTRECLYVKNQVCSPRIYFSTAHLICLKMHTYGKHTSRFVYMHKSTVKLQ